jgi:hypothetical protein
MKRGGLIPSSDSLISIPGTCFTQTLTHSSTSTLFLLFEFS